MASPHECLGYHIVRTTMNLIRSMILLKAPGGFLVLLWNARILLRLADVRVILHD